MKGKSAREAKKGKKEKKKKGQKSKIKGTDSGVSVEDE